MNYERSLRTVDRKWRGVQRKSQLNTGDCREIETIGGTASEWNWGRIRVYKNGRKISNSRDTTAKYAIVERTDRSVEAREWGIESEEEQIDRDCQTSQKIVRSWVEDSQVCGDDEIRSLRNERYEATEDSNLKKIFMGAIDKVRDKIK